MQKRRKIFIVSFYILICILALCLGLRKRAENKIENDIPKKNEIEIEQSSTSADNIDSNSQNEEFAVIAVGCVLLGMWLGKRRTNKQDKEVNTTKRGRKGDTP